MRKVIYLLAGFLIYSNFSKAQENQLVYKKIVPGVSSRLVASPDSLGYAISYNWFSFGLSEVDIGVWAEVSQNLTVDATSYPNGVVLYNSNFEPEGVSLGNGVASADMIWLPSSSGEVIINSNRAPNFDTNTDFFPAYPPIENYPSPTYGQNIFFKYDQESVTNEGLLNFSASAYDPENQEPFNGYNQAIDVGAVNFPKYSNSAIANDSLLISYVLLNGEQMLNNTVSLVNWGGQVNLVRLELNLNTNELTSQQIGSSTGSQFLSRVESAPDIPFLWRAGIVRGNNTPVSISGAEIEMDPNDSLYHVYITKESVAGETEWLTELYAYNNLFPDTAIGPFLATKFSARNIINTILSKDEDLYISSTFFALSFLGDTLMVRDYLGQVNGYIDYFPSFPPISEALHVSYSEASIYKINDVGDVTSKLSYTFNVKHYSSGYSQDANIYKVQDKLAWVQSYIAQNDTIIEYTLTESGGSEETTSLSLPAGKGSLIIWLDEDLSILNHWIIPYQSSNNNNLRINSILPYEGDTLLIQGIMGYSVTSDLNPFDETEVVTTENPISFFAFYSAPEIFTSTEKIKNPATFKVYPNPSSGDIRVAGSQLRQANYKIFDLSGRIAHSGNISQNELLNIEDLTSGMYILWIDTETGGGTAKFVVE